MKIEVGGVYETRDGSVVTIIGDNGTGYMQFRGSNDYWYNDSGYAPCSACGTELIKRLDKPESISPLEFGAFTEKQSIKKQSLKKLLKGKTISGLTKLEADQLAKLLSDGTILIVGE